MQLSQGYASLSHGPDRALPDVLTSVFRVLPYGASCSSWSVPVAHTGAVFLASPPLLHSFILQHLAFVLCGRHRGGHQSGVNQQEYGTSGVVSGFFPPGIKSQILTAGQNMKLAFKEWKCGSPTQIRNENLGDRSPIFPSSLRCLWEAC